MGVCLTNVKRKTSYETQFELALYEKAAIARCNILISNAETPEINTHKAMSILK